jgi:hypothetical protein
MSCKTRDHIRSNNRPKRADSEYHDEVERNLLIYVQNTINSGVKTGKVLPPDNAQSSEEALKTIAIEADNVLRLADANPQPLEGMSNKHHFALWNLTDEGYLTIIVD